MRRACLLLSAGLAVAVASPASAAIRFASTPYPTGAAGPDAVAVADLDGRNGPDVVVSLPAAGTIVVRLNDGRGGLGAPRSFATCAGSGFDVELGDLVGPARVGPDGKLDALVACAPNGTILPGDGAGGFGPGRPFPIVSGASTALHRWTPIALTRRRSGGAPLVSVITDRFPGGRRSCQTADLVNLSCEPEQRVDGPLVSGPLYPGAAASVPYDQVLTAAYDAGTASFDQLGVVTLLLQPGRPPTWVLDTWPGGGEVSAIALGDVSADGQPDVVIAHQVSSVAPLVDGLSVLLGAPGVGLPRDATPRPVRSAAGLVDVAVADVDVDGRGDVVAMGAFGRAVVHRALARARFAPPVDVPLAGYRNPAWSTNGAMRTADLDRDGRPDLVVADTVARRVDVLLNRSTRISPLTGIRRVPTSVRATSAGVVALGTAANPPATRVVIAIKVGRRTLATGSAKVPVGRTAALRAVLTRKARADLRARGSWQARLVLKAIGPGGQVRTRTSAITLRRPR